MRLRASVVGIALLGCDGKGSIYVDDTGAPPLDTYGTGTVTSACGASPPTIEQVTCENTGLMEYPESGEVAPTLTLWTDASDADGDLHAYALTVYYDAASVSAGSEQASSRTATTHEPECEVPSASLRSVVYIFDRGLGYSQTYEWGVQLIDAGGHASDLGVVTCTTPAEDGSGDP